MPTVDRSQPDPSQPSSNRRAQPGQASEFGQDIRDFPRGDTWKSPFAGVGTAETITLFGKFQVSYLRPAGWSELTVPKSDTRVALLAPSGDATLMIGAGVLPKPELPPGKAAESIAGGPFLTLLGYGAKSPVVMTIPIFTAEGDSGHMVNAPLMVRGPMVGRDDLPHCPMFKHIVVIEKDGVWFSFETQSWGEDLNIAQESSRQGELYGAFRVARL